MSTRLVIFNPFYLFSLIAVIPAGLNYTLCRFLLASYFGLLVQRMDGRGGRNYRALAMLLSLGFSIVLLAISPEIALAFGVGTLAILQCLENGTGKRHCICGPTWSGSGNSVLRRLLECLRNAEGFRWRCIQLSYHSGGTYPLLLFCLWACRLFCRLALSHGVERGWNVNGSGGECRDFARSIGKMRYRSMSGLQQSES